MAGGEHGETAGRPGRRGLGLALGVLAVAGGLGGGDRGGGGGALVGAEEGVAGALRRYPLKIVSLWYWR